MDRHGPPRTPADLQGCTGHGGALREAGRRVFASPQVQAGHGATRTTGMTGLECRLLAGTSRRQAQTRHRKPVVQVLAAATTGRAGRPTGSGRVRVATNGCFGDVEPERSGSERRAALWKRDRRVWVDCRHLRMTADWRPILLGLFPETALRRPAATSLRYSLAVSQSQLMDSAH
jgi:hypothetical protein